MQTSTASVATANANQSQQGQCGGQDEQSEQSLQDHSSWTEARTTSAYLPETGPEVVNSLSEGLEDRPMWLDLHSVQRDKGSVREWQNNSIFLKNMTQQLKSNTFFKLEEVVCTVVCSNV